MCNHALRNNYIREAGDLEGVKISVEIFGLQSFTSGKESRTSKRSEAENKVTG